MIGPDDGQNKLSCKLQPTPSKSFRVCDTELRSRWIFLTIHLYGFLFARFFEDIFCLNLTRSISATPTGRAFSLKSESDSSLMLSLFAPCLVRMRFPSPPIPTNQLNGELDSRILVLACSSSTVRQGTSEMG